MISAYKNCAAWCKMIRLIEMKSQNTDGGNKSFIHFKQSTKLFIVAMFNKVAALRGAITHHTLYR